ncbi:hypothetical protein G5I_08718 [Acromyrmex echinatior]|uniref:Uncharacterized protein n=1 Tax=Acromyrmex echinatior TaxID=103372 RepID=F4WSA2_ACREC|nr:hypothetical protein G5I_08718 [Acromyrmex echinatior]
MADEGSDTSDESLDVRSEKFDPLKALYSSKVRLASSVPLYDNISKFESVLKGINVSTKNDKSAVPESTRERFLSHQVVNGVHLQNLKTAQRDRTSI